MSHPLLAGRRTVESIFPLSDYHSRVIHYSPLLLNALGLVADLCGGSGTFFMLLLQKRFRFSIKAGVLYGGIMTLIPWVFRSPG